MTFRRLVVFAVVLFTGSGLLAASTRRHAVLPPVATTSEDLIDQALQSGKIDAQTALEYHVFADFNDPRLPSQYRGTVTPQYDSVSVALAEAQWDSLSPQIQQALTPFTIPPFVKGSYHSPQSSTRVGPLDISQPCTGVDDDNWVFAESGKGNIRVWWNKSHPEDAATAQGMIGDGEVALSQFEGLLGRNHMPDGGSTDPCHGGSNAIDVILDDVGSTNTIPYFPNLKACPSFVVMARSGRAEKNPQNTLAHELFHVMQFTYNVDDFNLSGYYLWLMEATAQWAMDYHRRPADSGEEQEAAPLWCVRPDQPLTSENDKHDYGAYLFFLYLSRTYGDNIIKSIWDATESHNAVDAVDTSIPGGFKERWPEFVVDAWNRGDVQQFQQWDQIANGAAQVEATLQGKPDAYATLDIDLPGLSALYFHYTIDQSVRSVAFLNGLTYQVTTSNLTINTADLGLQYHFADATDDQKRGASVQAITKINGQWQKPQVWTDTKYKMFCLQKPDEHIDELLLIFANSDTDDKRHLKPASIAPTVIATNIGCEWTGTLQFAVSDALKETFGNLVAEYDVTKDPIDPPAAVAGQDLLGYSYQTNGHVGWSTSGAIGPCTVQGGDKNAAVKSDFLNFIFNFAPPLSATYRKAYFPTFAQQPFSVSIICPPPAASGPVPVQAGTFFPPDFSLLTSKFLPIDATGKITGGPLTDPAGSGTWQYLFTPK